MAYLYNVAADFADEAIDGFVAAHASRVRRVPGGVVRAEPLVQGRVAVVIGGGSGHYPAFAGLVGRGLAAGVAPGNVFASPSARQIQSVARAADAGGGILFTYANYTGDAINFGQAEGLLSSEGLSCRAVRVTDDISSAPSDEVDKRRGVAGALVVFKIAGAAAESGADLEYCAAIAARANSRTRSLGVAFSGCTLPGAAGALFAVPPGRMEIGMGIHGEPGIDETDILSARELAALLVDRVLLDAPSDASDNRVAVVLNGLGSVKGEELFVLYGAVAARLEGRGFEIIEPEVGEFVTSFETAGVSLTVTWLDEELEELWRAPASTPAYRKGGFGDREDAVAALDSRSEVIAIESDRPSPPGSAESRRAAAFAVGALGAAEEAIRGAADELGRMDAVAGDGDHGVGMTTGLAAAVSHAGTALDTGAGLGTVLREAGAAWADRAGGTSGALWGVALAAVGVEFGDVHAPDTHGLARALNAAAASIGRFGKSELGDKTMLDTLIPFADAITAAASSGADIAAAWLAAAETADRAAQATAELVPRVGRARPLAARSVGTPDPGAYSMAIVIRAIARHIEEE